MGKTERDALCEADAASTPKLSGGTFLALLADDGKSAAGRFAETNVPIVRVDGLLVADNLGSLSDRDLVHPADLLPDGSSWGWRVFTGAVSTATTGSAASTCSGWSTTVGNMIVGFSNGTSSAAGQRRWFGETSDSCVNRTGQFPVYCLEK